MSESHWTSKPTFEQKAFDRAMAVDRLKEAALVMSVLNSNDVVKSSSTVDMDRLYSAAKEFEAARNACVELGVDLQKLCSDLVDKRRA